MLSDSYLARQKLEWLAKHILAGDNSKEVTPVPIPNTEVKLLSGDGTALCGRVARCQPFFNKPYVIYVSIRMRLFLCNQAIEKRTVDNTFQLSTRYLIRLFMSVFTEW